jgi:2'-5' RNA ligase
MRLFTALDLPGDLVRNLEDLLRRLKPTARIHWSPPANLHITTKFIGQWPEERLDELKAALYGIPHRPPIAVTVRGLGFFPRSFWCGIDAPDLPSLAADTDACTSVLGVPTEKRAFNPHLTLGKIKERPDLKPLAEAIARMPSLEFGSFAAGAFSLYQSTLKPSGSVYTKLAEFPLTKP